MSLGGLGCSPTDPYTSDAAHVERFCAFFFFCSLTHVGSDPRQRRHRDDLADPTFPPSLLRRPWPRRAVLCKDVYGFYGHDVPNIGLPRLPFHMQWHALVRGPTRAVSSRTTLRTSIGLFHANLNRPNMPNSEVEEPRTLVKSKLRSDELDEEEGFLIASCSRARRKVNMSQCFD